MSAADRGADRRAGAGRSRLRIGGWVGAPGPAPGRSAGDALTVMDPSARDVHPGRSVVGVQTVYALSGQ